MEARGFVAVSLGNSTQLLWDARPATSPAGPVLALLPLTVSLVIQELPLSLANASALKGTISITPEAVYSAPTIAFRALPLLLTVYLAIRLWLN